MRRCSAIATARRAGQSMRRSPPGGTSSATSTGRERSSSPPRCATTSSPSLSCRRAFRHSKSACAPRPGRRSRRCRQDGQVRRGNQPLAGIRLRDRQRRRSRTAWQRPRRLSPRNGCVAIARPGSPSSSPPCAPADRRPKRDALSREVVTKAICRCRDRGPAAPGCPPSAPGAGCSDRDPAPPGSSARPASVSTGLVTVVEGLHRRIGEQHHHVRVVVREAAVFGEFLAASGVGNADIRRGR